MYDHPVQKEIYRVHAEEKPTLPAHDGIYTQSYQQARARYDSMIRNWNIYFYNNFFEVVHKDTIHYVYFEHFIRNCDCNDFISTQSGTCMHIESVERAYPTTYSNIRPLAYLDKDFQATNIYGKSKRDELLSKEITTLPCIEALDLLKSNREIPHFTIPAQDLQVFSSYGITLFPFQIDSLKLMLENKRTVLTLQMGLGKTLCALAAIKILNLPRHLIVVPNNLKSQWLHEINKYNLGSAKIISKGSEIFQYKNEKFLIISYELLARHKYFLENLNFNIAIIDEIQKIKNQESQCWEAISLIDSEFVFALSGTPIQNSVEDLVSVIRILNPKEFLPEWKFFEEFCMTSRAKVFGLKQNKIKDLKSRLARYIINPPIDESTLPLPDSEKFDHQVKLNKEQAELHDHFIAQARPLLAKSVEHPLSIGEKALLNSYLSQAAMASVDANLVHQTLPPNTPAKIYPKSNRLSEIESIISTILPNKIVVFSSWIRALNLLKPFLKENNIQFSEFNSEISIKNKDKALDDFISGSSKILLATDSAGSGLDGLQLAAHHIIHIELLWNPMKIEQRNGRCVRALQKAKTVYIHNFFAAAEIDEMIAKAGSRKRDLIRDMMK